MARRTSPHYDRVKTRDKYLQRVYGITLDEYNHLLHQQDYRCGICLKHQSVEKKALAVDHDHITGEIRGLLCMYCNHRRLGRARDPEIFRRMAEYLEKGTGWFVPKKKRRRK